MELHNGMRLISLDLSFKLILLVLLFFEMYAFRTTISRISSTCLRMNSQAKPFGSESFKGYKPAETKRDAYASAKEHDKSIAMPSIILVTPFLDQNVGMVSRAMLNWGLTDLRLVNPVCNHLSDDARAIAVGSYEILEHAKLYPTLKEAVADLQFVSLLFLSQRTTA